MERDLAVLTLLPFFGAFLAFSASRRLIDGPQGVGSRFESAGLVFLWSAAFALVRFGLTVLLRLGILGFEARGAVFFAGIVVSYGVLVEGLSRACRLSYGVAALHAFVLAVAHFASRLIAYDLLLAW